MYELNQKDNSKLEAIFFSCVESTQPEAVQLLYAKPRSVFIVPGSINRTFSAKFMMAIKVLSRLKSRVFWVNMASDVDEDVTSCEYCQRTKLPQPTKAPLLNSPIGRTVQILQVDVLGSR